jgi:hypothetical protein
MRALCWHGREDVRAVAKDLRTPEAMRPYGSGSAVAGRPRQPHTGCVERGRQFR